MSQTDPGKQGVGVPLEDRAERASIDVEAKRRVLQAAIELRDRLVLELWDAGLSYGRIAKVMHMSPSRITQIVGARG